MNAGQCWWWVDSQPIRVENDRKINYGSGQFGAQRKSGKETYLLSNLIWAVTDILRKNTHFCNYLATRSLFNSVQFTGLTVYFVLIKSAFINVYLGSIGASILITIPTRDVYNNRNILIFSPCYVSTWLLYKLKQSLID